MVMDQIEPIGSSGLGNRIASDDVEVRTITLRHGKMAWYRGSIS